MNDERKKLASLIIAEIKKGKSGSSQYGDWTLYKIKFANRKETFSWFASNTDSIPRPKDSVLYLEYIEDTKDDKTFYTIKKMELEETSNVANSVEYVPPQNGNLFYKSRDVGILTSYAKDLFIAKMQIDDNVKEMTVSEICKQSVLCGLAMYNKINGIESKKTTKSEPKQEKNQNSDDGYVPF